MKLRNLALIAGVASLLVPLGETSQAASTGAAAFIRSQTQNFTPIEKAACGPRWGRWCGPFHHRVCGPYRCWCAPC